MGIGYLALCAILPNPRIYLKIHDADAGSVGQ